MVKVWGMQQLLIISEFIEKMKKHQIRGGEYEKIHYNINYCTFGCVALCL